MCGVTARRTFFELRDSPEPVLRLWISGRRPDDLRRMPLRTGVTPNTLIGLLDKAKAYPLLGTHHPESLEKVDSRGLGAGRPYHGLHGLRDSVGGSVPDSTCQDALVFRVSASR